MSTLNTATRNVKPARYSRPFGEGLVDAETITPTPAPSVASKPARPAKGRVEYTPADAAWWSENSPSNALESHEAGPIPTHRKAVRKPVRKLAKGFVPNPTDQQARDMVEDLGGYPKSQDYQSRDTFAAEFSREYARRFGR